MGNISQRLGKTMPPDQIAETLKANKDFANSFARLEEHLNANNVDFRLTPRTAGPPLTMDPEKETFVGDFAKEANMLLSRNYRQPFVVPEIT